MGRQSNKLTLLHSYHMTTTVKVTYSMQGSPDTNLTFDFTGIDLENIKKELPQKKKELDSKFNIDPEKSNIRIDDTL
jgi:hypothetical protein